VPEDEGRDNIREALVRLIIRAGAEGTRLDPEDCDVLTRYGTGVITHDEMMSFFRKKAARIQSQIDKPQ
jgi:hypothetical protein